MRQAKRVVALNVEHIAFAYAWASALCISALLTRGLLHLLHIALLRAGFCIAACDNFVRMQRPLSFKSLKLHAKTLASDCPHLAAVYEKYGSPPLWDREPGFATLLQIILEQQVSLASAKACFDKLTAHLGNVAPETVLSLNDAELKTIGFSRQKTTYARHLSEAILEKNIDLDSLFYLPDAEVKTELIKLKGIGEWTSDIYLLMALLRPDVMPKGDIALH